MYVVIYQNPSRDAAKWQCDETLFCNFAEAVERRAKLKKRGLVAQIHYISFLAAHENSQDIEWA